MNTRLDPAFRLLNRELILLVALVALAVAAFFLTRRFAEANIAVRLQDAAAWYQRGKAALGAGDTRGAVEALRRSSRMNPTSREVALALAGAYAADRQDDVARQLLIGLRDTKPEDVEVNLQLARLEARGGDVTLATRYYHGALDALWPIDQAPARRPIRLELIRLLLDHGDTSRALSEVLRLTPDLPADVPSQIEAGSLYLASGAPDRALALFTSALAREPRNMRALSGAGRAAFEQGDYVRARRYFSQTTDSTTPVAEARELTELILENDPLAPRLLRRDRQTRLAADLAHAADRLVGCAAAAPAMAARLDSVRTEVIAFEERLTAPIEPDDVEEGTELAVRAIGEAARACPPASPFDRAMALIGRAHRLEASGT